MTLLNQYPRQLGESILLLPVDDDTPRGVMVLGLGPTGDLTGTQLSAVTTRGLKEKHMPLIVDLIDEVIGDIENEERLATVRKKVNAMMADFLLFGY